MVLTQEAVLSVLVAEGGKVRKADFVGKFRGEVDCDDPAEKERNRELFKTFVNNVAFVKEDDGVRYVVVRKMYQQLLEETKKEAVQVTDEQQRQPVTRDTREESSAGPEQASEGCENPSELLLTPIELALQRSKYTDIRVKRMLNFELQQQVANVDGSRRSAASFSEPASVKSKPYALPLRMPQTRVEVHKLKGEEPPGSPNPLKNNRKPSVELPQLRTTRSPKVSEEPKETPSMVPLEQTEHQWLVKCASGHWRQVYGMLLRDNQLAGKRDFMSGFTALHWAAKCGNIEMLEKIIDLSRQGGVDIDINAKTHGGYTPLHIAALHDQERTLAILVGEYGADASIRDNCGKKAYHYLPKGVSVTLREMLGEPTIQQAPMEDKEEPDLLPELSKGLHSISRLFQPYGTSYRKKNKQRPAFYSLSDEPSEGQEDGGGSPRNKAISDAFM
ncbi:ankyrin repeat domain-containing protein SOWAHA [Aulostomus maculatus]